MNPKCSEGRKRCEMRKCVPFQKLSFLACLLGVERHEGVDTALLYIRSFNYK
jgi:hypothetical protein